MKSTYFLIGAPWDGLPLPDDVPLCVPFDPLVSEIGEEACLLDSMKRCRFVRLSALLSCNAQSDVDRLIAQLVVSWRHFKRFPQHHLELGRNVRLMPMRH